MAQLTWGKARQLRFKDDREYYWALGSLCRNGFYTITYETNSETESWADAFRIKCLASDRYLPEAFIKAMRNARRINCNDYVQNLYEKHNFTFNKINKVLYGKYDEVRKTVPQRYAEDFDAGYQGRALKIASNFNTGVPEVKNDSNSFDYEMRLPEEITDKDAEKLLEGQKTTVTINAYERNPEARKRCLAYYSKINGGQIKCEICGFDFSKVYGKLFEGKIHVHHIVEISSIGEEYEIDAERDLIPVCPNCHMVLHSKKPAFSVDAVREMLKQNKE